MATSAAIRELKSADFSESDLTDLDLLAEDLGECPLGEFLGGIADRLRSGFDVTLTAS